MTLIFKIDLEMAITLTIMLADPRKYKRRGGTAASSSKKKDK